VAADTKRRVGADNVEKVASDSQATARRTAQEKAVERDDADGIEVAVAAISQYQAQDLPSVREKELWVVCTLSRQDHFEVRLRQQSRQCLVPVDPPVSRGCDSLEPDGPSSWLGRGRRGRNHHQMR
jgi:hypothetical protein